MVNYNGPGLSLKLTAPTGGVVTGVPVKIGRIFGVPANTVAQTLKFSCQVAGEVTIPKVNLEPWTEGMLVWWNTNSALASSTSTTSMLIGVATEVRASGTATGRVLLNYGTWLNQ